MVIQRAQSKIPTIIIQPTHDVDKWKSPSQQMLEREKGIRNDNTKKIAQMAVQKVYEQMQKLVKNTEVNVRISYDELGGTEQFELSLKRDGKVVASIPPDAAIQIAKKAKQTTLGLLFDISA